MGRLKKYKTKEEKAKAQRSWSNKYYWKNKKRLDAKAKQKYWKDKKTNRNLQNNVFNN